MADGACQERPDLNWQPAPKSRAAEQKAVCARCLVRTECLTYALDHGVVEGVWGGATENERRKLRGDSRKLG